MAARALMSAFCALFLTLVLSAEGAAQAPARGAVKAPPAEILDLLKIATATVDDASKFLGTPRATREGIVEYSAGGYLFRLAVSTGAQQGGYQPGVILGVAVQIERPRRTRDLAPILLNGYWTPKACDEAGHCALELGSFNPLHVARLKDLGLDKHCAPSLREDIVVVRYSCDGKATNGINVQVQADLKFGLERDLATRAERARLMLKIRDLENDPNNPDRTSTRSMREQFGIMGSVTNEAIWKLVQDLPVSVYSVFTPQAPNSETDDNFRTASSLARG